MKHIGLLFLVTPIVLTLGGCGKSEQSKLVGVWMSSDEEHELLVFHKDGTMTRGNIEHLDKVSDDLVRWSITDGRVAFTNGLGGKAFEIEWISDTEIRFKGHSDSFVRIADSMRDSAVSATAERIANSPKSLEKKMRLAAKEISQSITPHLALSRKIPAECQFEETSFEYRDLSGKAFSGLRIGDNKTSGFSGLYDLGSDNAKSLTFKSGGTFTLGHSKYDKAGSGDAFVKNSVSLANDTLVFFVNDGDLATKSEISLREREAKVLAERRDAANK